MNHSGAKERASWPVWLYGALLITIGLAQLVRKMLNDAGGFGSRYAILLVAVTVTLGLVAHHRKRAIGPHWLWLGIFWFVTALLVTLTVLTGVTAFAGNWPTAGLCLGGAVLLAPGWMGLRSYGYGNAELWTASPPSDDIR